MNLISSIFIFICFLSYAKCHCVKSDFFHLNTEFEPVIYTYSFKSTVDYVYPEFRISCSDDESYNLFILLTYVACPGSNINILNDEYQSKCTNGYLSRYPTNSHPNDVYLKSCHEFIHRSFGISCSSEVIPKMIHVKNTFEKYYSVGYEINDLDFLTTYTIIRTKDDFIRAKSRMKTFIDGNPLTSHDNLENAYFKAGLIFKEEQIELDVNLTQVYTREYQIKKFKELIKNDSLVEEYFSDDNYLMPGQLILKDDMYYRSQKLSTFFYENTTPMWRTINEGNWKLIGDSMRRIVEESGKNLDIYVVPIGYLQLYNRYYVNLIDKPRLETLFIKIPQIIVKIVVDPLNTSRGIIFNTINDPYCTLEQAKYLIFDIFKVCMKTFNCTDKYPDFLDPKKGLTLCCSVADSNIWKIVMYD